MPQTSELRVNLKDLVKQKEEDEGEVEVDDLDFRNRAADHVLRVSLQAESRAGNIESIKRKKEADEKLRNDMKEARK